MRGSLSLALAALGVIVAFALLLEIVFTAIYGPPPLWVAELLPIAATFWFAVGLLAWRRRPANRTGPLLIAGGLALALGGLAYLPQPGFLAAGLVFAVVIIAVVVHVVLAFPSGRLPDRASRRIVAGAYVLTLVVYAPQYLFGPIPSPVRIADDDRLYDLASWAGRLTFFAVAALSAAVLVRRVRAAPSGDRPGLSAIYAFGVIAMMVLPFAPNVAPWLLGLDPNEVFLMQMVVLAAVPIVFGAAMLSGEFKAAGGVEVLVQGARADAMEPAALERSVAAALGDPSVRLALGSVPAAEPQSGRGIVEVRDGSDVVATVEYDALLFPDPATVESTVSLLAVLLQRDRLARDLREHQRQLLESRDQVVAAADDERRRIARDLHDGLQAQLVLLAIQAGSLDGGAKLADDIGSSIDGLRALIDDVMPPVLLERGLGSAVTELAHRAPVPVELRLDLDGARLRPAVETTSYFVVAEAITNALRHAAPTQLRVLIEERGDVLAIEVGDDGCGGATAGGGVGLGSVSERVVVLGGSFAIDSPPGGGTTIRAQVPCGS